MGMSWRDAGWDALPHTKLRGVRSEPEGRSHSEVCGTRWSPSMRVRCTKVPPVPKWHRRHPPCRLQAAVASSNIVALPRSWPSSHPYTKKKRSSDKIQTLSLSRVSASSNLSLRPSHSLPESSERSTDGSPAASESMTASPRLPTHLCCSAVAFPVAKRGTRQPSPRDVTHPPLLP